MQPTPGINVNCLVSHGSPDLIGKNSNCYCWNCQIINCSYQSPLRCTATFSSVLLRFDPYNLELMSLHWYISRLMYLVTDALHDGFSSHLARQLAGNMSLWCWSILFVRLVYNDKFTRWITYTALALSWFESPQPCRESYVFCKLW